MILSNAVYMPQLKWKAGEIRALATLPPGLADRTLPVLKVMPGSAFDPIEQRTLSTTETIRLFGRRLSQAWGRRLAFVDAELIDEERSPAVRNSHPLTELIERARIEGSNVAPVVTLRSSSEYKSAVKRYKERNQAAPICLRIGLPELESIPSFTALHELLAAVDAAPKQTVLLIDGGPIHITQKSAFVDLFGAHLARLAPSNGWLRVFWATTTFPNKPKLRAGEIGRFPRDDWALYEFMVATGHEMPVMPLFSDYALEFPGDYKPIKVSPTAHFRYSTDKEYIIFKGTTTKKPNGYAAIFPVAHQVVQSPDFHGRDFSMGDSYIANLTNSGAKTGHASAWRWASTDHHFRVVHSALARALSLPATALEAPAAEQLLLV